MIFNFILVILSLEINPSGSSFFESQLLSLEGLITCIADVVTRIFPFSRNKRVALSKFTRFIVVTSHTNSGKIYRHILPRQPKSADLDHASYTYRDSFPS